MSEKRESEELDREDGQDEAAKKRIAPFHAMAVHAFLGLGVYDLARHLFSAPFASDAAFCFALAGAFSGWQVAAWINKAIDEEEEAK